MTITHGLAGALDERFGPRPRMAVIPDGVRVDMTPAPPESAERRTPTGGRLRRASVRVERRRCAARSARRVPEADGLIVGGHRQRAGPRAPGGAGAYPRDRGTGDLHRPRRAAGRAALLSRATVLVLPNPASAISTRFTSPLKLFEYMAAGRPIVASDLPAIREVLTRDVNALLVPPGSAAALADGIRRLLADPGLARGSLGRGGAAADYTWDRRATASRRSSPRSRWPAMISERLLTLVRCPECQSRLTRDGDDVTCTGCGRQYRAAGRTISTCARRSNTRSRRSISTRRCTPTPVTSGYRRRCSARRSATACCATSSLRAERPRGRPRMRQRPRAAVESRLAATTVGIDISPFFAGSAGGSGPAARRPAQAAVRRRHLHQGLLARRPRAPVARGAAAGC